MQKRSIELSRRKFTGEFKLDAIERLESGGFGGGGSARVPLPGLPIISTAQEAGETLALPKPQQKHSQG